MKKKFKVILMFFMFILSLFSFTSCMKFNCETCGNVKNTELITLTKRNAISTNGTTLSVVATINPSYSDVKSVSWSLAWNPSYDFSGWAFGAPDITKYIKLTPSTDTLTCSVKITSGYSLPTYAILTCTSNSNTNLKATCKIDYVGRNINGYSECFQAKYEIDENDMNYDKLLDMAVENLESNLTSGGSVEGVVKNIRLDSGGEWETYDGYIFLVEDSNEPIIDTSYYDIIMQEDFCLYIPIIYDVYYNNILVASNIYGNLEIVFS